MIENLYLEHEKDITTIKKYINGEITYVHPGELSYIEQFEYLTLDDLQQRMFSFLYLPLSSFSFALEASTLYAALHRYKMAKTTYGHINAIKITKSQFNEMTKIEEVDLSSANLLKEDTLFHLTGFGGEMLIDYHFIESPFCCETLLHVTIIYVYSSRLRVYNFNINVSTNRRFVYAENSAPDEVNVLKAAMAVLLKGVDYGDS